VIDDKQFNLVSSNSGFEQVGADNTYTSHTQNDKAVDKSGICIFMSAMRRRISMCSLIICR
jgi:hypothetical protein